MAPFAPWADIPSELLIIISDRFGLIESYICARCVCTAWRAALPPPITVANAPRLRLIRDRPVRPAWEYHPDDGPVQLSALFVSAERSVHLATLPIRGQYVGSSNGWLAVREPRCWHSSATFLVNPLAGDKKVDLLPLWYDGEPVPKIVFAPKPTDDDYVAVAICDLHRLAYTKTRDMKWMILYVSIGERDRFVDPAYDTDAGKVYCVTMLGDVHVLHIPRRQRRRPIVEPLQAAAVERAGLPYDPAADYATPYDTASKFTDAKHVFFFGGNLYQVWRTTSNVVPSKMPGGGKAKDDMIFVLKYDPERRPCWDVVKDLGGYSVFVGKNQPVVLRPEDAPGVRANCVYWIKGESRNEPIPMVFDIATGISTLHPSADKALNPPFCWYFFNNKDMIMSIEDNGRKRSMSGEDLCVQVSKSRKASAQQGFGIHFSTLHPSAEVPEIRDINHLAWQKYWASLKYDSKR